MTKPVSECRVVAGGSAGEVDGSGRVGGGFEQNISRYLEDFDFWPKRTVPHNLSNGFLQFQHPPEDLNKLLSEWAIHFAHGDNSQGMLSMDASIDRDDACLYDTHITMMHTGCNCFAQHTTSTAVHLMHNVVSTEHAD